MPQYHPKVLPGFVSGSVRYKNTEKPTKTFISSILAFNGLSSFCGPEDVYIGLNRFKFECRYCNPKSIEILFLTKRANVVVAKSNNCVCPRIFCF